MRSRQFVPAFVLVVAATALAGETTPGGIAWMKSYGEGVAAARAAGRHLVVDFYTPT